MNGKDTGTCLMRYVVSDIAGAVSDIPEYTTVNYGRRFSKSLAPHIGQKPLCSWGGCVVIGR